VVGKAGILVDPFSEAEIAQALAKIIEGPGYRDELRVKGIARAKLFDWKRTAQLTLEAYQRAGRKAVT
jgi:glycosyltransferase involved in cell wall biosynthesis